MKSYDQLEFTDDFMFCKVLSHNLDLCKSLLELILNIRIRQVVLPEAQKTLEILYDARGIRLDVYVDDEQGTVYDIEMQTSDFDKIPKRSRYYQGMIDLSIMERGASFKELKRSYIIFLCTGDPFGKRLPIYTFENYCSEDKSISLGDEAKKVIVNPDCDRTGLSAELCSFLDLLEGKNALDGVAKDIEKAVNKAIEHKEWRLEYMTFAEKLQNEREEGREEGRAEGREEGKEEGKLQAVIDNVDSLTSKMHMSVEQAMDALDVSPEMKEKVLRKMAGKS